MGIGVDLAEFSRARRYDLDPCVTTGVDRCVVPSVVVAMVAGAHNRARMAVADWILRAHDGRKRVAAAVRPLGKSRRRRKTPAMRHSPARQRLDSAGQTA